MDLENLCLVKLVAICVASLVLEAIVVLVAVTNLSLTPPLLVLPLCHPLLFLRYRGLERMQDPV